MSLISIPDVRIYKPMKYAWAYDAWLMQRQIAWLPQEVPLGEDVKDYKNKLTVEEQRLLTQIFRFFTQCYDEKTEILSSKGWVKFSELESNALVAEITEEGELNFVNPTRFHESYYSGPMYRFADGNGRMDLLVTPNHKMAFKNKNPNYRGDHERWIYQTADKFLPYQGVKILRNGYRSTGKDHITPMDRLRIAYQADGRHTGGSTGARLGKIVHHFAFTKERKIERLEYLIKEAGVEYTKRLADNGYTCFRVLCNERMKKDFSWVDISDISTNWCREFLNELYRWDGRVSKDIHGNIDYSYTNIRIECLDVVQAIAVISGWSYSGLINGKESERNIKYSDCWIIHWRDSYNEVDGQAIARGKSIEDYSGKVYCVTVPSGKVVVRRNGKVAICGNSDIDVGGAYLSHYLPTFQPTEVRMMLGEFMATESVHVAAYSHLLDTLGLPETEYSAFLEYAEMREKHDYLQSFSVTDIHSLAVAIAVFAAFAEGLQLFASFAMLLNFPRHNKMKGMGQIITWSVRDEFLHVEGNMRLFHTLIEENPEVWTDRLKEDIYTACRTMVDHEKAFIKLAFGVGGIEGMTAEDISRYIEYIADRRLLQLRMSPIYGVTKMPIPWLDDMLNAVEFVNFFEQRATEYSKASTTGSWEDVWQEVDSNRILA